MGRKFIFLYNIDDDLLTEKIINKLNRAGITFEILDYSIFQDEIYNDGQSLWILAEQYLIAWTIINYEEILGIQFYDEDLEIDIQYGVDWLNSHNDNEIFVKYL